jgi:hypothetical protein
MLKSIIKNKGTSGHPCRRHKLPSNGMFFDLIKSESFCRIAKFKSLLILQFSGIPVRLLRNSIFKKRKLNINRSLKFQTGHF